VIDTRLHSKEVYEPYWPDSSHTGKSNLTFVWALCCLPRTDLAFVQHPYSNHRPLAVRFAWSMS